MCIVYMTEALRSESMRYLDDLARPSDDATNGSRYSLLTSANANDGHAHDNLKKSLLLKPVVYIIFSGMGLSWLYRRYALDPIVPVSHLRNERNINGEVFYHSFIVKHQIPSLLLNIIAWIMIICRAYVADDKVVTHAM
jgi:hypothetical protein